MAAGGAAGPGGGSGAGGAGARAPLWGREWEKGWRSADHPLPHPPGSQPGLFPPEPAGTGWMGADGLWEGGGRGERAGARRGFICKVPPPPSREVRGSALVWAAGGCAEFPLLPPPPLPPPPPAGQPPGCGPAAPSPGPVRGARRGAGSAGCGPGSRSPSSPFSLSFE